MEYPFSEQEQRIRKEWLLATRALYFGLPMVSCVAMFILYYSGHVSSGGLAVSIFSLIEVFVFYICYLIMKHCAYKKYGTLYMTFGMVMSILHFVAEVLQIETRADALGLLLLFAFLSWWLQASYRLRPLNKRAERWKDYAEAFDREIKNGKDISELDRIYSDMVKNCPEVETSTNAYQERKLAFEQKLQNAEAT